MGQEEQLKFLHDAFSAIKPRNIIEIGTHRCLFDLFILTNFPETKIYTCDPWERSYKAVRVIEKYFPNGVNFKNVPSDIFLADFNKEIKIEAAWVDGDHSFMGCYEDLLGCSKLGVQNILLDDFRLLPFIKVAIDTFLNSDPYYKKGESNIIDTRGIYWLERKQGL